MPVIASRLALVAVHALLHYRPGAIIGDEEAMQIELEPVLDSRTIDLGHKPAGTGKAGRIEANALAKRAQFLRRASGMPAASAANMDAELALQRRQPTLERTDHAGRDTG